jgi:predicted transposase/invertase (TIGR01784 family)
MCELPEEELPATIGKISQNVFSTPKTYRKFSDKLNIIFIELPDAKSLLNRDLNSLSDLEKWYIFLLYADKEDKKNIICKLTESSEGIKMAEAALSNISFDLLERLDEISREKWEHDRIANKLAREKKFREAEEKARQDGLQRGIQQGIQQMVKLLIKRNMPLEEISELSGLSLEEIKKLND